MTFKPSLLAGAAACAMPIGGFNPMLRGPQVVFSPNDPGGSLSVDQAVALLDASDPSEDQDQDAGAPQGAAATDQVDEDADGAASADDDAAEEAASLPEDDDVEADVEAEEQDPAVAPAEAPKYWSKEAKAQFAQLPPALQAVVLAQEGPREAATAKAKADAQAVREKADKDLADVSALATGLNTWLPQAIETFRSRWGDQPPDWVAYGQKHGAEAMTMAKARYDQQREQLQQTAQAASQAQAKAHEAFLEAESAKLAELAPELVDKKEGPARRRAVGQYLVDNGLPKEALPNLTAAEMVIARKAMLWDQAQAKAKSPTPKPAPAKPGAKPALARGGAAAGPVDPKSRQVQKANNRFAQTRSVNDLVALLNAESD